MSDASGLVKYFPVNRKLFPLLYREKMRLLCHIHVTLNSSGAFYSSLNFVQHNNIWSKENESASGYWSKIVIRRERELPALYKVLLWWGLETKNNEELSSSFLVFLLLHSIQEKLFSYGVMEYRYRTGAGLETRNSSIFPTLFDCNFSLFCTSLPYSSLLNSFSPYLLQSRVSTYTDSLPHPCCPHGFLLVFYERIGRICDSPLTISGDIFILLLGLSACFLDIRSVTFIYYW